MIEKSPRSGSSVEVTFRVPPIEGAVGLYLCGDFNNWHTSGIPFRQEADGSWVTRIVLEAGKSYRFRYCDNQSRWHNEREADAYVPNAFGTEDSVVDLAAPLQNTGAEPSDQHRGGPGAGQRGGSRDGVRRAGTGPRRPASRQVPGARGHDETPGSSPSGGSGRGKPQGGEQRRGGTSGRGRHRRRK